MRYAIQFYRHGILHLTLDHAPTREAAERTLKALEVFLIEFYSIQPHRGDEGLSWRTVDGEYREIKLSPITEFTS